jgi:mannose-6-phosphate isomerase-like protein (cupin superfamily)
VKRRALRFGKGFNVLFGTRRAQAAQMVLEPGSSEGHAGNRHAGADQWLFVVDGTGEAIVNGRRFPLRPMTLVLIEHGDRHEIRNTGRKLLKTLNVYVPPAYTGEGDELPAGKPAEKGRAGD